MGMAQITFDEMGVNGFTIPNFVMGSGAVASGNGLMPLESGMYIWLTLDVSSINSLTITYKGDSDGGTRGSVGYILDGTATELIATSGHSTMEQTVTIDVSGISEFKLYSMDNSSPSNWGDTITFSIE